MGMKAGAKAMTKGALMKALATEHGLKQKACTEVINSFVDLATKEVKKTGVFTVPGLCRIKTRTKPATKAGVRVMFGKETKVKAKPAKTIVKAYPVAAFRTIPDVCSPWESRGAGSGCATLALGHQKLWY